MSKEKNEDSKSSIMTTLDFDEHRFQAACAAMTGLLSNNSISFNLPHDIAFRAVIYADAILDELKGVTK